jgi:hypothetical protein
MLVYENYTKFISATDTIAQMKVRRLPFAAAAVMRCSGDHHHKSGFISFLKEYKYLTYKSEPVPGGRLYSALPPFALGSRRPCAVSQGILQFF